MKSAGGLVDLGRFLLWIDESERGGANGKGYS